jgi:hypothetical protein
MRGIYLTEQGKAEIQAKIVELEEVYSEFLKNQLAGTLANRALVNAYKEILSSAIILPVEESWSIVEKQTNMMDEHQLRFIYPQGVVIYKK